MRIAELEQINAQLSARVELLTQQLDWFKRQLFGRKSEKRLDIDAAVQGNLLMALGVATPPAKIAPSETITYQRRKNQRDAATVNDSGLRFDDTVPVQIIEVADPDLKGIPDDQIEIIGEKITWRLAQRPGSYTVLKYVRKVGKRRDSETLHTVPAPANVLERSVADVSLLASMLTDKFLYHLPLYRQHQRMGHNGIQVSRASLTQWCSRAIDLLEPIYATQFAHVRQSRVLAMDETPTSGRCTVTRTRSCWLTPLHGRMTTCASFSASTSPARCSVTATRRMPPTPGSRHRSPTQNVERTRAGRSSRLRKLNPKRSPRHSRSSARSITMRPSSGKKRCRAKRNCTIERSIANRL